MGSGHVCCFGQHQRGFASFSMAGPTENTLRCWNNVLMLLAVRSLEYGFRYPNAKILLD